jgi:hypothetical protein
LTTLTVGDYSPITYTYTTGSPYFGDNMTYNTAEIYNSLYTTSSLNSVNSALPLKRKLSTKSTETGRVEKGSQSNQNFQTVNKKFYHFTTNVVEFHIKPKSQMHFDIKDINKMNKYCTKCGRKSKQNDNFCSGCGNRF